MTSDRRPDSTLRPRPPRTFEVQRRRRRHHRGLHPLAWPVAPSRSPTSTGAFKGEQIEVLQSRARAPTSCSSHETEFKELTGIEVGSEQVPEQQQRQKAVIEFTSGSPSFDVTDVSCTCRSACSARASGSRTCGPISTTPSLTAPDFDFADFSKAGLHLCDPGRRPDRHAAAHSSTTGSSTGTRSCSTPKGVAYPTDLRRDGRRRRKAARPGQRRLSASSRAA